MKNNLSAVLPLALAVFVFFSPAALAHPGRTDANGGHYNRSTGEYHYHHGYPEHQHYDMDGDGVVDCPYDFVDKTDHSSGSSSKSKSSSSSSGAATRTVPVEPAPVEEPEQAAAISTEKPAGGKSTEEIIEIVIAGVCLAPIILSICSGVFGSIRDAIKRRSLKNKK